MITLFGRDFFSKWLVGTVDMVSDERLRFALWLFVVALGLTLLRARLRYGDPLCNRWEGRR